MGLSKFHLLPTMTLFAALFVGGCNKTSEVVAQQDNTTAKDPVTKGIDISLFKEGAFIKAPEIVDCETTAGTKTTCYKLVTAGRPGTRAPGPFCPRTINDTSEDTGAWFSKEGSGDLVDLTGDFIANLSTYYDDPNWQLYDTDTGKVRYTATQEACFGAARPDVEEQYKQNCIECEMSYLEEDFSLTYLIPTTPIPADSDRIERVRTAGIALDGAELAGPAPVDEILGSYTIAAFDDCGGHINAHQGYHYHSVNGCTNIDVNHDGYAPLIGYAPDGYAIYAMRDAQGKEAESLDECRGTTDPIRGYHYRAASPSENMIIGCLHGETVRPVGMEGAGGPPPGGPPPGGEGHPPPRPDDAHAH
ncbi:YHYH protein [Alteromonas sp. 14N.309.X.WAT.G.H12]|uniref:YHYH protein n=1 Tax=Alteromonas sp. 14N.309.X.WAT.G.H12 TaxID=3120824 RepID=UPI002FD6CE8A